MERKDELTTTKPTAERVADWGRWETDPPYRRVVPRRPFEKALGIFQARMGDPWLDARDDNAIN